MTIFEDRNLKEIIQVKLGTAEKFEPRMSSICRRKDEYTHTWLGWGKYRKRQRNKTERNRSM